MLQSDVLLVGHHGWGAAEGDGGLPAGGTCGGLEPEGEDAVVAGGDGVGGQAGHAVVPQACGRLSAGGEGDAQGLRTGHFDGRTPRGESRCLDDHGVNTRLQGDPELSGAVRALVESIVESEVRLGNGLSVHGPDDPVSGIKICL